MGALKLSSVDVKPLNMCWNDAFRKIFGINRWESVASIQYFCNELSFMFLYELLQWKFTTSCGLACPSVEYIHSILLFGPDCGSRSVNKFSCLGLSAISRREAVMEKFKCYCQL